MGVLVANNKVPYTIKSLIKTGSGIIDIGRWQSSGIIDIGTNGPSGIRISDIAIGVNAAIGVNGTSGIRISDYAQGSNGPSGIRISDWAAGDSGPFAKAGASWISSGIIDYRGPSGGFDKAGASWRDNGVLNYNVENRTDLLDQTDISTFGFVKTPSTGRGVFHPYSWA